MARKEAQLFTVETMTSGFILVYWIRDMQNMKELNYAFQCSGHGFEMNGGNYAWSVFQMRYDIVLHFERVLVFLSRSVHRLV